MENDDIEENEVEAKPLKKILLIAVPALVLVVGLVVFFFGNSSDENPAVEKSDPRLVEAEELIKTKSYEKTRGILLAANDKNPDDLKTLILLARVNLLMNRNADALEFAERVLGKDPNSAEAYYILGTLDFRKARFEDALKHERQALTLNPKMPGPYFIIGEIFLRTGDTQNAMKVLLQGVKLDPEDVEMRTTLSAAYLKSKNYEKVLEHAQAALKVDPSIPGAHLNLSQAYFHLKNGQKALEHGRLAEKLYTEKDMQQWAAKSRNFTGLILKKFKMRPEDLTG